MFHVEQLRTLFEGAGLHPTEDFLKGALQHLEDIYRWNKVHDLTAVPPSEAAERHTLDSILPFKDLPPAPTVLDVGSGAGLPGIPLSLWWPSSRITLLEPLRKRRSFLETECARLGLETLVRGEPVEQLKNATFSLVTSRATLPWRTLIDACAPVVEPGGRLLGLLGPEQSPTPAELEALRSSTNTWSTFHVEHYTLPSGASRVALHALRSAT